MNDSEGMFYAVARGSGDLRPLTTEQTNPPPARGVEASARDSFRAAPHCFSAGARDHLTQRALATRNLLTGAQKLCHFFEAKSGDDLMR
jgi:hypothetical protein